MSMLVLGAVSAGAAASLLWALRLCEAPLAVLSVVAGMACVPAAVLSLPPRRRTGSFFFRPANGCCPECGYSNEGLGAAGCPECGGRLPPSDDHLKKLLEVHGATGPGECVVCGRGFPQGAPLGAACPGCGSRHRRPAGGRRGR